MKTKRTFLTLAGVVAAVSVATAQSYFDDDIYYDASNEKAQPKTTTTVVKRTYATPSAVIVAEYPSADNYTVSGTRSISVDDYNRRGIFAIDSLSADTTATDFACTRRIEQFYNPDVVSGTGDQELANIYYMEPENVNIYVNTPSGYWGYDYFYTPFSWYSPYWSINWRWYSPWYWSSWYDPYWYWAWDWGWGPSWGWSHPWRPVWGPSWGHRPYNPRHQGARLGYTATNRPSGHVGSSGRAGLGSRHEGSYNSYNRPSSINSRPGIDTNGRRGLSNGSVSSGRSNGTTTNRNNSTNSYRQYNTNGGRSSGYNTGTYNSGESRSSGSWGGSYGGGGRSSGGMRSSGGGRGRH